MLRLMQHVDVTLHLKDALHIDPALQRLGVLAQAFEGGGTELRSLRVRFNSVTSYNMAVNRGLVAKHRDVALRRLGEEFRDGGKGNGLFRRMLVEGVIVAIR